MVKSSSKTLGWSKIVIITKFVFSFYTMMQTNTNKLSLFLLLGIFLYIKQKLWASVITSISCPQPVVTLDSLDKAIKTKFTKIISRASPYLPPELFITSNESSNWIISRDYTEFVLGISLKNSQSTSFLVAKVGEIERFKKRT